jgi:hypothetical protein
MLRLNEANRPTISQYTFKRTLVDKNSIKPMIAKESTVVRGQLQFQKQGETLNICKGLAKLIEPNSGPDITNLI